LEILFRSILCLLMAFTSMSVDLYLPALPTIGRVMANDARAAEITITGFLMGFAAGQLFWGPLSDRVGRKRPLLVGLALFVLGSVGCALSQEIGELVRWRLVQAFGASAGVVIARAMVRDKYGPLGAASALSTLIGIMAIAPLVAPVIGGQILRVAPWQSLFWLLALFGALVFLASLTLPETRTPAANTRGTNVAGTMLRLFSSRAVLLIGGAGGLFYCGLFAYITAAPSIYMGYFGVSPQAYGLLYGASTAAVICANLLNARLVRSFSALSMLICGTLSALAASLILSLLGMMQSSGFMMLCAVWLGMTLFASMVGFVVANSLAGAMQDHPDHAGSVSALVGAVHYGAGIFGSVAMHAFGNGTPLRMGLVMTAASTLAAFLALSAYFTSQGRQQPMPA
jgi:DHA1 family bicyclomycin/chloramphenicol resistance-like MFS transporter